MTKNFVRLRPIPVLVLVENFHRKRNPVFISKYPRSMMLGYSFIKCGRKLLIVFFFWPFLFNFIIVPMPRTNEWWLSDAALNRAAERFVRNLIHLISTNLPLTECLTDCFLGRNVWRTCGMRNVEGCRLGKVNAYGCMTYVWSTSSAPTTWLFI